MSNVHNIQNVRLSLAGLLCPPSGDGEWLSAAVPEELTVRADNDGVGTVSVNPDNNVVLTVSTQGSSDCYAYLAAMYDRQKELLSDDPAFGGFEGVVQNERNGTTFTSDSAWISQAPGIDGAREAGTMQWTVTLLTVVKSYGEALEAKETARNFLAEI